jgi:hypothetical protein
MSETAGSTSDGLPEVDFSTFLLSLAHSVLVHLGVARPPEGDEVEKNLPLARQTIELMSLLAEKTKGNLSGAEERLLEQLLMDVRTRYSEEANSQGR